MTEKIKLKSMPFDSNEIYDEATGTTSYDRVAYSKDLAEWMRNYFSNGILVKGSTTIENQLKVTHKSALTVTVAEGEIIINGRTGWVENPTDITVDMGGSLGRIDRVVMELNVEDRYIYLNLLKGTEAETPEPPSLTQTEDIYQISLAQVKVDAGSAVVSEIIDERTIDNISHVTIGIEPPRPVYANEAQAISVSDTVSSMYGLSDTEKDVDHALQNVRSVVPSYTVLLETESPITVDKSTVVFQLDRATIDYDEIQILIEPFTNNDYYGNLYFSDPSANGSFYCGISRVGNFAILKKYGAKVCGMSTWVSGGSDSITSINVSDGNLIFNDNKKLWVKTIRADTFNIKVLGVKYNEN